MKWISVKDRLPEESGWVVVAKINEHAEDGETTWVMSMPYSHKHKAFNSYDWMEDWENEDGCIHPDFWTEMPKFPKGV